MKTILLMLLLLGCRGPDSVSVTPSSDFGEGDGDQGVAITATWQLRPTMIVSTDMSGRELPAAPDFASLQRQIDELKKLLAAKNPTMVVPPLGK